MNADKVVESHLFIEENITFCVDDLVSTARQQKEKNQIGFIAIDHLQILRASITNTTREMEIIDIVSKLKRLALELNVPILLLTGLIREPSRGKDYIDGLPLAHHIKYHDSINGYLDSIATLYQLKYYAENEEQRASLESKSKLTICKSLQGEIGQIDLCFNKKLMRFFQVE